MKYDLIVFGGGTSGIASAYIASKYGLNTLLVEKSDVLGGSITQGLVIPAMKIDTENINTEFFNDLAAFADKYNARHTYLDGNKGWFNPELLKIVFDDMLSSVKCNVLFSSEPTNVSFDKNNKLFNLNLNHKILSIYIESKYIVDATSNGKIFQLLDCDFQISNEKFQNPSLRFILSNINIDKFSSWLSKLDSNKDVTTIDDSDNQIYLSTAYTWDESRNWALKPYFKQAVEDGIIEYTDTAYFQVFSIPQMANSLAFNCPRILLDEGENPNDPFVYSRALKQGRERVYRLSKFCQKYLPGFENSYISHIADMLGVRESYRIKGKYTMTKEDIISGIKPENIALCCDYPIDIHSNDNKSDCLEFTNHKYYLPLEALISDNNENLYGVGRILSADFEAHSALRTQMSCFSMGEAASKDILKKLKN